MIVIAHPMVLTNALVHTKHLSFVLHEIDAIEHPMKSIQKCRILDALELNRVLVLLWLFVNQISFCLGTSDKFCAI
jgi:hypothetical protein